MKGRQSKIRTRVQSQVLDNGNRITDEGKECDRIYFYIVGCMLLQMV